MIKHTLKNKSEIFSLLKNIQKSRQQISISFDGLPNHGITILLDIHKYANILIFDESNPKLPEKLVENKGSAVFSLKLDNLPVTFSCQLLSNNKKPNQLYAHFPKEIYYPQNRNNFRYRTEFLDGVNAIINLSENQQLDCTLVNISVSGLCIRLPHKDASIFKVNNLINDIQIKLDNTSYFTVAAKIQFARYETSSAHMTLGLHIHNQKNNIAKTIQKFIYSA